MASGRSAAWEDVRGVASAVPASHAAEAVLSGVSTVLRLRWISAVALSTALLSAATISLSLPWVAAVWVPLTVAEVGLSVVHVAASALSLPTPESALSYVHGWQSSIVLPATHEVLFMVAAVFLALCAWHAVLWLNAGVVGSKFSSAALTVRCLVRPRQWILFGAELLMNGVFVSMLLWGGAWAAIEAVECPAELYSAFRAIPFPHTQLAAHTPFHRALTGAPSTHNPAHYARVSSTTPPEHDAWGDDNDFGGPGQSPLQAEAPPAMDTAGVAYGCYALPPAATALIVCLLTVSAFVTLAVLRADLSVDGRWQHRWAVMAGLHQRLTDFATDAQEAEEVDWRSVKAGCVEEPHRHAGESPVGMSAAQGRTGRLNTSALSSATWASSLSLPAWASGGSAHPLVVPPRLLPSTGVAPGAPSCRAPLLHRLTAAPVDMLRLLLDVALPSGMLALVLLLTCGYPLALGLDGVLGSVSTFVRPGFRLVVPASSLSLWHQSPLQMLWLAGTICCAVACAVSVLSAAALLRVTLTAGRLSGPLAFEPILYGMPMASVPAKVNWAAKPALKHHQPGLEDPLAPTAASLPFGSFDANTLGIGEGQVDAFSVRFSAATMAPSGTLTSYLQGWSARGLVAAQLHSGALRRPTSRTAGATRAAPPRTSAAASALFQAPASGVAADNVLAWVHRMRDGQLALYAGACRAAPAPSAMAPPPGGVQAGSRMLQAGVSAGTGRDVPVVTPAVAALGCVATEGMHVRGAVCRAYGPHLPPVTAADVTSHSSEAGLARSLAWQDMAAALGKNSYDLKEVTADPSGNRLSALVWAATAVLDASALSLQAASAQTEAPTAAIAKGISTLNGGGSVEAPGFVLTLLRELAPLDPVVEQARWLSGGSAGANARARASALASTLPSTPRSRSGARRRSSQAALAPSSFPTPLDARANGSAADVHGRSKVGDFSAMSGTGLDGSTLLASIPAAARADSTTGRQLGLSALNATGVTLSDTAGDAGGITAVYMHVDGAAAFDYVVQTACVPGSGLSVGPGILLCPLPGVGGLAAADSFVGPDGSLPDDTLNTSAASAWTAVSRASVATGVSASGLLDISGQMSELAALREAGATAVSHSSVLVRLAAMAFKDTIPGQRLGLLGRIVGPLLRTPRQARETLLWDAENTASALQTLQHLAVRGRKLDKHHKLPGFVPTILCSISTLYLSAREFALSPACSGGTDGWAKPLLIMGGARVNRHNEVLGQNPSRALRQARVIMCSLAFRHPALLALILGARGALVAMLKAYGKVLLDPSECPMPPSPTAVLAQVHRDMQQGLPWGVELSEFKEEE